MTRTDGRIVCVSVTVDHTEKGHGQISRTIRDSNILIYCISNTKSNIVLLHWNKQHLERGIIQWGCGLLNENFHLVLMITCFAMQICNRVEHWAMGSTLWQNINQRLAFEADICTRWKRILVQRFSEFLLHLFLRISTIDIVILINVIDLSHQIIELGEDRDDGYCKC